jgi:hypothetical protein
LDCTHSIACFADDGEAILIFENAPETLPNKRMVVDEQNCDSLGHFLILTAGFWIMPIE